MVAEPSDFSGKIVIKRVEDTPTLEATDMAINVAKSTKEIVENLTTKRDMYRSKYNELVDEYNKSLQRVVELEIEVALWKQQVETLRN